MRCIEIFYLDCFKKDVVEINFNMRCIEIDRTVLGLINIKDKLQHEMY